MQGNYGVPNWKRDPLTDLEMFFESNKIQIRGLIVCDYSKEYSHWNAVKSLGEWLTEAGVPALYGIDTRSLTKFIRDFGSSVLAKISFDGLPRLDFEDPNKLNLVSLVSTKEPRTYCAFESSSLPPLHILAFDCGIKFNIIRFFIHDHRARVTVVPFDYDLESNPAQIRYDGIFISNGPGDPTFCQATVASLKFALALDPPKPIMVSRSHCCRFEADLLD